MINVTIKGIPLKFKTSREVFSPQSIDLGTLSLLSYIEFKDDDFVLDLGCGYGVVGILAAKIIGSQNVILTDIHSEAIKLSKENADLNNVSDMKIYQGDGLENVQETNFSLIISNPPYHSDFSVAKHFIQKGFNRLKVGGKMCMVAKRELWYKKKLSNIFGGVKIHKQDGYFLFMAEKKSSTYAHKRKKV